MSNVNSKTGIKTEYQWSMRCGGHTYITLYYEGKFVHCYDNDMTYMGSIIEQIEKRTKMKFEKIPIHGNQEDFNGLRFAGGFKHDWCKNPITTRDYER